MSEIDYMTAYGAVKAGEEIAKLKAKVEELTAELRTIYDIVGASNSAEEIIKRIDAKYPALKQGVKGEH